MGSFAIARPTIQPIEQPDVLQNYGRLLQLNGITQQQQQQAALMPLQMQAAQQAAESGAIDLQEKRIQLKDEQAMNAAVQQWGKKANPSVPTSANTVNTSLSGQSDYGAQSASSPNTPTQAASSLPDYDELIELAKRNGASFKAIQGLQSTVLGLREKASTIAMNDARTGASNATAMKTKNDMLINAMSGVLQLPDDQLAPTLISTAQDLANKGILDPQHAQMAQQLAQLGDPQRIRTALRGQIAGMGGFNKMLEDAQKQIQIDQERGKSDPNSPFFAPSSAAVALGTAPGTAAVATGEAKQAGRKAAAEAAARQPFELALARQRQALTQGDPDAAGQLLVDGDATLSQLKARGSTPEFIQNALNAAKRISGGRYNAQQAEADFKVAESPAQLAFFGSAKSLTDPGGTLDQLEAAGKDLPGGKFPALNKIADWEKAATGTGPVAKYAATALGIADDYAKVVGGGVGTDTARQAVLDIIPKSASPEQRAAAIQGIRGTVHSQVNSRIGKNKILQRMYGEGEVTSGAGSGFWSQIPGAVPHQ